MLHFQDAHSYKVRDGPRRWAPLVVTYWEFQMLWLLRRETPIYLLTHVDSSFSDGAHSSVWCCAINASCGVSGAITERLWGTNFIRCSPFPDQEPWGLSFVFWPLQGLSTDRNWCKAAHSVCRQWWGKPVKTGIKFWILIKYCHVIKKPTGCGTWHFKFCHSGFVLKWIKQGGCNI